MSSHSKKILKFWRNLEIFHLPDFDNETYPLYDDELPWEMPEPLKNQKMSRRYTMYFGKVAKKTVIDHLRKIAGGKNAEEWMEPVTGYTCMAAITLDESGRPFVNSYVHASFIHGMQCLKDHKPLSELKNLLSKVQGEFEKRYNIEARTTSVEEGMIVRKGDIVTIELLQKEIELLNEIIGHAFDFESEVYWNEKEVNPDSEVDAPILNSFYLEDLNMLISRNDYGSSLSEYLSEDIDEADRKDMINDRSLLLECLHPVLLSPGRWPSPIEYGLYTAQQGAVNTVMSDLKRDGGIRGINGPPGTGKTTLLLDIIADIIVTRARRLLDMDPTRLFKSKANAVTTERDFKYYYYDFEDISLFEGHSIVVASNNNKAVENISMELPSVDKVDRKAFPDANYFADCASRLLEKKEAWGILSAPLGNAKNKYAFRKNFWESSGLFPGFKDYLHRVYKDKEYDLTEEYIDQFKQTSSELRELLDDFEYFKVNAGVYQSHQFGDAFFREVTAFEKKRYILKKRAQKLQQRYGIPRRNLVNQEYLQKDHKQLHVDTPYVSPELNRLRSLIFIKSLELHEAAILANAVKFKNALSLFMDVLTGKIKVLDEVAVTLWNTFFFCVPVVSTTLASVARLFRQIPKDSIGWLLLDEAGQATPQSAAGIISRSKRSIIVGDPLQIEPVVTHPEQLVKILREQAGVIERTWSPLVSSVQSLADRVSPRGTYLGKDETISWSGFPLRAHRRCDDPMFEIANNIAYDGQMVKATIDKAYSSALGKSCWFDVSGHTMVGKHVVDEEIKLLQKFITILTAQDRRQDIYVISPFVSVKEHCEEVFKTQKHVKCGTVHTFQGREADTVFLILGSDPSKPRARQWVTKSPNIINVAVTRARHRIFVVGNRKKWGKLPYIEQLWRLLPAVLIKNEDIATW